MFPFIAALSQAAGIVIDKIGLTRRQIELKVFIPVLFLCLFATCIILFPFLGKISPDFFSLKYISFFVAMIVLAVVWNIFYYRAVQSEKIHEFELVLSFQPLATILLASVLFAGERNWQIVLISVIAAVALVLARIKKNHFDFSPALWGMVVAILFMSVELLIIKELLDVLSPVALYTLRTGLIFLFFYFYYRPHMTRVSNTNSGLILLTATLGTIQMVTKFYGFQSFGIVYTSLILILSPILVYIVSTFWMNERIKLKTYICFILILACVVYATVLENRL